MEKQNPGSVAARGQEVQRPKTSTGEQGEEGKASKFNKGKKPDMANDVKFVGAKSDPAKKGNTGLPTHDGPKVRHKARPNHSISRKLVRKQAKKPLKRVSFHACPSFIFCNSLRSDVFFQICGNQSYVLLIEVISFLSSLQVSELPVLWPSLKTLSSI